MSAVPTIRSSARRADARRSARRRADAAPRRPALRLRGAESLCAGLSTIDDAVVDLPVRVTRVADGGFVLVAETAPAALRPGALAWLSLHGAHDWQCHEFVVRLTHRRAPDPAAAVFGATLADGDDAGLCRDRIECIRRETAMRRGAGPRRRPSTGGA